MEVRHIWSTPDAEKTILYIARVSNPANQDSPNTKLINYCIKHKHWSPFEMANMCVEIITSRAIAAQILRHRSFSFQEFSQRYARAAELEPIELRRRAEKNRQSSLEVINPVFSSGITAEQLIRRSLDVAQYTYNLLIEQGVAKETARMVLPLTTQTKLYMNGSLRSWIHYINIRTQEDVQKEHRDVAQAIKVIFVHEFPIIAEALEWK